MAPEDVFAGVDTILVIDWPDREVPEQLALAGFGVVVRNGPGPEDYAAYEVEDGGICVRRTGRPPERAGLVYAYRPLSELPQIIATALDLQAQTVWTQSGLDAGGEKHLKGCWLSNADRERARNMVQAAGLKHVSEPYIVDAVQGLATRRRR